MVDIAEERGKWAELVGRFILSFGDIENTTFLAIAHLPTERIFDTASSLQFAKRVDLVLELLANKDGISKDVKTDFTKALRRAKKLSEMRNIIAHSPLWLDVYSHEHTGEFAFQQVIRSIRNQNKIITRADLEALVSEAESLSVSLYELQGAIYGA